MLLHTYQKEAYEEVVKFHEKQRRCVLALPTGSGKTVVAAKYAKECFIDNGKRVLWIAHRKELLEQAVQNFLILGLDFDDIGIRFEENLVDYKNNCIFFYNNLVPIKDKNGSSNWPLENIHLIVIDEAHRTGADTYRKILQYYKADQIIGPKVLGLTATPYRIHKGQLLSLNEIGFDGNYISECNNALFENIAYNKSFTDLVHYGCCAPFLYDKCETNQSYELEIDPKFNEFTPGSTKQLNNSERNKAIVNYWISKKEEYGKTLVFAINVEHAWSLFKIFNTIVPAGVVVGEDLDRDKTLNEFRNNNIKVLINVEILTEGLDIPDIKTIILARPTTSPIKYLQMIGRGSRVTSTKLYFNLIDVHDRLSYFKPYLNYRRADIDDVFIFRNNESITLEKISNLAEEFKDIEKSDIGLLLNDKSALIELLLSNKETEYEYILELCKNNDNRPILLTRQDYNILKKYYEEDIINIYHLDTIIDYDKYKTIPIMKIYAYLANGYKSKIKSIDANFINALEKYSNTLMKYYNYDQGALLKLMNFYKNLDEYCTAKYSRTMPIEELTIIKNNYFKNDMYLGVIFYKTINGIKSLTLGPKTHKILVNYFDKSSTSYRSISLFKEKMILINYFLHNIIDDLSIELMGAKSLNEIFVAYE